jgi:hypothetical protein
MPLVAPPSLAASPLLVVLSALVPLWRVVSLTTPPPPLIAPLDDSPRRPPLVPPAALPVDPLAVLLTALRVLPALNGSASYPLLAPPLLATSAATPSLTILSLRMGTPTSQAPQALPTPVFNGLSTQS